jgi:MoaA/NifB/PqqE/SkfB family radical SAM enzyme
LQRKELPKNFCFRPWNEVYAHYDTCGPCCINYNLFKGDFNSYLDSKELKELKKALLAGERHPSCINCWKTEDSGMTSIRQKNSDVSSRVHRISLTLTDKCNFKCIMCNPIHSSAWSKDPAACSLIGMSPRKHDNYFDKIDWVIDLCKDKFITLTMIGGEPLICDEYNYFLEQVKKHNLYDKIRLVITTNLSVLKYKGVDHLYEWSKFPNKNIYASFDGLDGVGEYIRTGFKMKKFEENLIKAIDHIDSLSVTVQIYNIFDMPNIFKFADKYKLKISFNFLTDPEFLSLNNLTKDDREKVLNFYTSLDWYNEDIFNILNNNIFFDKKEKLLQFTKDIDSLWNRNCLRSIPELEQIM